MQMLFSVIMSILDPKNNPLFIKERNHLFSESELHKVVLDYCPGTGRVRVQCYADPGYSAPFYQDQIFTVDKGKIVSIEKD